MSAAVAAFRHRTFAALRFRNYRLYLASQLISFSGTWMQSIAEAWLVLELTGSGTALGAVVALQFLPTLILGPYGGMIADRLDKRRLIMVTQSIAGVLALTLGIVTLTGVVELWMVFAIAAGFGAVTAVDNPSRQTFVIEMVGPDDLSNAVTLNSVTVNAARVVGPAVGGIMIATLGVAECFIGNAISYIAVITALHFIRRDDLYPVTRATRAAGQLRQGFNYVWNQPTLRTTVAMLTLIGMLTFEFNVTLPLLADHTFGVGAGGLATMSTLMGVGAVCGGLVVASSGAPTVARLSIVAAAFSVAVAALGATPSIGLAYAVMPLVGATSVSMIAMSASLLQLNADPDLRGRVMSLFAVAVMGTTPIGGLVIGWIGEHAGPRQALWTGAAAAIGAAAIGWRHTRHTAAASKPDDTWVDPATPPSRVPELVAP